MDEFSDARLFQVEAYLDSKRSQYLQTGMLPARWSMEKRKVLVLQAQKFTWAEEALYRIGKDGILRWVPEEQ
ncbi:hypothetical protein, partial [Escherichia coli]|uniref:hypothetical protein n=1 Tax=Escherichia coli TaxID=562 RepID=UPI00142D2BCF